MNAKKSFFKTITGAVFPERCALCDRILGPDEPFVCASCSGKVRFIQGRTCVKCGCVLKSRFEFMCSECLNSKRQFDEGFAPFSYSGLMRESMVRYKYSGRAGYASFYAMCIYRYGARRIKSWDADALVPVPVHFSRYQKRGYDQSLLLAKELSKLTGIRLNDSLVKRVKRTEAQKELGAEERRKNLMSAFKYVSSEKAPDSVIIVDDIFTTGSTVNALCSVLRMNGAKHVYVVCVCIS